jgi:hypothetical protein
MQKVYISHPALYSLYEFLSGLTPSTFIMVNLTGQQNMYLMERMGRLRLFIMSNKLVEAVP